MIARTDGSYSRKELHAKGSRKERRVHEVYSKGILQEKKCRRDNAFQPTKAPSEVARRENRAGNNVGTWYDPNRASQLDYITTIR